jgi:stearoyl-CoA desaturase (delta-9 desaturase)
MLYAGVGVAMTFHRTLSHGAFTFHPIIRKILIVIASFANVGSPLTWVAVHRAHHKYCDTPKDPHTPVYHSFWYMMFGTMFAQVSVRLVKKDMLADPFVMFVHKYYYAIQIPWIILLYMIGGPIAVIACHIVPGGLTWLAGSFVNLYNHVYGYQNFDTKDTSTNSWVTAILVMGEGWHNNHHALPNAATTKVKPHEFDLLYWIGAALGGVKKQ